MFLTSYIYVCNIKFSYNLAGIYLLKVNKRNTRTRCEICSELTIKIPERRQWLRSSIFIVNFEYISHLVLVFYFEHVIAGWVVIKLKVKNLIFQIKKI